MTATTINDVLSRIDTLSCRERERERERERKGIALVGCTTSDTISSSISNISDNSDISDNSIPY
jgi:hypothetical protein